MKLRFSLLALLALPSFPLFAQQGSAPGRSGAQNAQPQATGTVTGHVYCNDTQRPARFADVELLRQGTNSDSGRPTYQPAGRARTALDGSFSITGVAVGDYYVGAQLTGYVSASAVARMAGNPIAGVPLTHVDVNRSGDVQVRLERGAVVSGRVAYDDGTPIPGVSVRLRPVDSNTGGNGGPGGFAGGFGGGGNLGADETDDRGIFRASGLPPGRYVATATVQTETTGRGIGGGRGGGFPAFLNVYAPAAMHKADARVVEIRGGETVDGVDIQVALAGLHTVQGTVVAKSDSHPLNSGMVALSDAADASFSRTVTIDPDGTFRVEYLPPGNYSLRVQGQDRPQQRDRGDRGQQGGQPGGETKRYQSGTATATVGELDVTVDPVQLEEAKPANASGSTSASGNAR